MEPFVEITREPWQFPLYVQVQTPTEPVAQQQPTQLVRMLHTLRLSACHSILSEARKQRLYP